MDHEAVPQFDRSRVAQHNDDAQGYWLIIGELVYDVTDFLRAHPGGDRILQLYAGRDATRGFEQVHKDRRDVARMLERYRIGAITRIDCSVDRAHAPHHRAWRALDSALQLVVEMQNALSADHSFQLAPLDGVGTQRSPPRRSRYELQRGLETHARFHHHYLDVLIGETWVELAASMLPGHAVETELHARRSVQCIEARTSALALLEHVEQFAERDLAVTVACFEVLDGWLLRTWKHELSRALRVFERAHSPAMPIDECRRVYSLCDRLLEQLGQYLESANRTVGMCRHRSC
jgi:cytochrome b involved in lipid metabolism